MAQVPPVQGMSVDDQAMWAEVPQGMSIQGMHHRGEAFTQAVQKAPLFSPTEYS